MDLFEESLQENIGFECHEDLNTFEKFLEPEEYIDLGYLFITDRIFSSNVELGEWAKQTAINVNTYLILTRYQRSRALDRLPYVTLACERGGSVKKYKKLIVDNEEEEIPKKKAWTLWDEKMLQDLRRSSCNRPSSSGRVMFHLAIYYNFFKNKTLVVQLEEPDVGKNTVEEVLRLSVERGYTVFHRNREDSNVLSDIVVAHPTSIAMIRTWLYVLIMDTTYKTNKYNMSLLECVGMTPTGKNFTWQQLLCAMNRERHTDEFFNQSSTYILHMLCQMIRGLDISSVAFWGRNNEPGRERTFCVEAVAINVSRQGQIAEIKYTLEISKLKEKYGAKSNPIMKNLSNKISHLGLKKIIDELKKACQMVEEPGSNYLHYLRKSYGLPCACELVNRCQYLIPIQEEDVHIFWRKLEIGYGIPEEHDRDMKSEMRDLTSLLQEISTGPISNVREVRQIIEGVIYPVLHDDPCQPLSTPPRDYSHERTTEDEFYQKG
ncbi:hypothetical protein M9H77_11386 [Catharanthus roseus]|uniref:Uncharacterized protein n=1 Tax=Catharanthus roseus TaxID=4058 RepID=A0ACC0BEK8_CATRO|nr:hypothetical protein M9H77_11386 [Catharanthus roseus]